jgi:hypothetical protein
MSIFEIRNKFCAGGGIGIRAGLRSQWGNPWEFESPPAHLKIYCFH